MKEIKIYSSLNFCLQRILRACWLTTKKPVAKQNKEKISSQSLKKVKMNQFASLLLKQAIQNFVIRNNQLGALNRITFFCTDAPNKLPLSKNPKHKTSPRITLISGDDKIEITTLDQARKIADRRQLKLVSILDYDTKTSRPLYK